MMLLLGIAIAGAIGAVARYQVDASVVRYVPNGLPVGTLAINVSGSFVLGLITGLALYHGLPNTPRVIMGTGFCGAYTTFSTFAYEVVRLADERQHREALTVLALSLVFPALVAALGMALASL
jgi:fluoride exporter